MVDSDVLSIAGGKSVMSSFEETWSAGTYQISVEDLTTSFTVTAPPDYTIWILIVIIAASAIIYAYRKGMIPPLTKSLNSNLTHEKRTNWRNKK